MGEMNHMTEARKYELDEEIFKVLANAKRLSILHALDGKEMSVGDITKLIGIRKPNVSQHLTVLRYARLVKARRHATTVYYKVTDPKILECCAIIQHFAKKRRML